MEQKCYCIPNTGKKAGRLHSCQLLIGYTFKLHVACKLHVYLNKSFQVFRDRGCYNKFLSFKTMVLKLSGRRITNGVTLQNKSLINFQHN